MRKRISAIFISTSILILILLFLELTGYKCIYRKIFNIYCVGCGFTRMIKAIIKLDFYQAFRFNPLLFILLILFIPYFIYQIYLFIKYNNIKEPSPKLLIILLIIFIRFMILRNLPKFNYLIPTKIR